MISIKKSVGIVVSVLTVTGGSLGLASSVGATSGYGYHHGSSTPTSTTTTTQKAKVTNNNKIDVNSSNHQYATSGSAQVTKNKMGGDATSGDASNSASLSLQASINNKDSGAALTSAAAVEVTPSMASPHGNVTTKTVSDVSLTNNNAVNVITSSSQTAKSGNATVSHNVSGGNATTGDATNTSNTTLSVSVAN